MDGINWNGLVQRTNPFASFTEGMQAGTAMRQDQERQNIFRQKQALEMEEAKRARAKEDRALALDNENRLERGILGHMGAKDPRAAQMKAVEVGQYDIAEQMGKLNEEQRKAAREKAEDLGGFAATLAQQPYEARKGIIQQAVPILQEMGFTPEQIATFDPSDQALQALVASSTDLKTALEEANRQRDDKRAAERDAEMQQYRADMLGLAGRRVGVTERREKRVATGRPGAAGGGLSSVKTEDLIAALRR